MTTDHRSPQDDALVRGGLRVVVMNPTLADALTRFHEALTATTTRSRFFAVHPHLSAEEVRRFTHVDHVGREALVASDRRGEIVAVARFDRLRPGSAVAEVAFVVADAWQHHGIGGALFARIAALAVKGGVDRFVADTLVGNRAMRAVFRDAGYPVHETVDGGVVRVTIQLTPR